MLRLGVVSLCLFLTTFVVADRHNRVYTASLGPIQGSGVSGRVVVFAATGDTVAFSGFASGLQANLKAANCTAEDGTFVVCLFGLMCLYKQINSHAITLHLPVVLSSTSV